MKKGTLILLLLIASFRMKAGGNDTIQYPVLNKDYIRSYWYDSKSFVTSPVKWGKNQWIGFGAVAGAGLLAYIQDEKIQTFFTGHQSVAADNFSKYIFEPVGNGKGTCVLIGGLYIGGRLAKDKRLAGTSLTAAKAFIVSSVCVQVAKQLTHRHRPFQDQVPDHARWDGPASDPGYNSFPSGHSAAAFSVATVFAMEYSSTIWIPALAYTLAAGTAVSRLYDNKHWASDVVIGSAVGFVSGRFMWKQSRKGHNRLVILPMAGSHMASVAFLYRIEP